jgi:glycosyltransferase involved in cell wall biosynthesis
VTGRVGDRETGGAGDAETRRRGDGEDSSLITHHSSLDHLRILHVITSLDVGGAQKHLLSLVKGLRGRGHTADVAFFKNPSMVGPFSETGATLFDLSARGTFSPLLLPKLAGILRQGRYQVVHTHLLKADTYGTLAGVVAGTPVRVASKHNDERALLKPAVALVHGLISRLDHRVVALSDYVALYVATLGRVDSTRISRIYYGLPASSAEADDAGRRLRTELGIPYQAPLLATVGRLTEQKGLLYLLEAMAIVHRQLPEARLLVVGDAQDGRDEYKQGLLRTRAKLGLEETVLFTGVRDDVPAVMRAIDLFVMASLWEGFGLVFLEAMAAAKPIVATRVSAIPEVVADGVTGLLVPPQDSGALAEAMLLLLNAPERGRQMGKAGLIRLQEHFTEERMVDEIECLYLELLGQRTLARR